jgi:LytS/YehU family sensor histidine kinase
MEIDNEQLCFYSENSIGKSPITGDIQQHSGIGLENVKKRLGLLFPGNYVLNVEKGDDTFKVRLCIKKEKHTTIK